MRAPRFALAMRAHRVFLSARDLPRAEAAAAPLSAPQGADTPVWLATLPDGGPTGGFFSERAPHPW